ncbi:MAG: hypothetical protein D6714_01380 [Bacteroidetes bacterium]|nr:MAG: hypothetical protein D6714_01380 [Bacteroidota bacterium]
MKTTFTFWILIASFSISYAQQTVGLFQNTPASLNGYTLFSSNRDTYLIDNCGRVVHKWTSNYTPGSSVYLLENGNLLRTARIGGSFSGGGIGGRIELFDWDNNLLWAYNYADTQVHQHHDIEPLPNGNFLLIAWEAHTATEAIAKGRNPATVGGAGLWSEQVVEIEMVGTDQINIVWEWHLWDHLIQDFDPAKENFGVIAEHPELVDINLGATGGGGPGNGSDWIHANAINYNPELDQIILSSRHHSEVWIIDHSTTSAEAATHLGGNAGKGGDLLYRWGNPANYDRGAFADQKLYGQHDARWVPAGYPDAGKLMVFNNGQNRPGGNFSSVDKWAPPTDADGAYILPTDAPFGPDDLSWTYTADPPFSMYSSNISGAQPLPNGNVLICVGRDGHFLEVSPEKEIVWEYVNPVSGNQITTQGQQPQNNGVFRATRLPADYPAFADKDLTPGDPIELNPLPSDCEIYDGTVAVSAPAEAGAARVVGNPVGEFISIENPRGTPLGFALFSPTGEKLFDTILRSRQTLLPASDWPAGLLVARFFDPETGQITTQKLIKP